MHAPFLFSEPKPAVDQPSASMTVILRRVRQCVAALGWEETDTIG